MLRLSASDTLGKELSVTTIALEIRIFPNIV